MKPSTLLITFSGEDRPGIVAEIAAIVHDHGGNWEQSRLVHLSERFVGLLQVSSTPEHSENLRLALLALPQLEMTVAFGAESEKPAARLYEISVLGTDDIGIVRQIFNRIAELGLNVENLSTRTEPAADSGTLLFRADARLSTMSQLPIETIRETVEALSQDLQVDLSVTQPE